MLQRLLIGVVSVLPALAGTAETGSAALAATSEAVEMLDGAVWSGPVSTPGHPLYDLRIEVVGGQLKADYPDLDCGGIWEPVQSSQGSIFFYERLSYGHFQCYDDGWIELRREGATTLSFFYRFLPSDPVDSRGSLQRE